MFRINKIIFSFIAVLFVACINVSARNPIIIHSHNDYNRTVPFYQAYSVGVQSIEADVFLVKDKLLVGHEINNLRDDDTFEKIYVNPIVEIFSKNSGRAWKDSDKLLQLVIEIKSEDSEAALKKIIDCLSAHSQIFDCTKNDRAVRIVITGNIPSPEDFYKYPDFIYFDGDLSVRYTSKQLERVAMFSMDFSNYAKWNGKGSLILKEDRAVKSQIAKCHSLGKPIRFWNAPEGPTVYYTFYNLGVDYINTDNPVACAEFFSDFSNKNFTMGKLKSKQGGVTGTKKLDIITKSFEGFENNKLSLSKGIDVYKPTYLNDGKCKKIKNVILLIGDGMGLNQISAGYYANCGLSLMNMHNIGIQINNALDAFTTDSAAGGSALATGERHNNRHISITADGKEIPSLSDYFKEMGKSVGVVSLGNIADATPAAFYAHATDRDSATRILNYLHKAKIDLLCGSGFDLFEERGLDKTLSDKYLFKRNVSEITPEKGKLICIDDKMGDAANEENLHLLADAVKNSIARLQKNSDKGFFLMAEGAKIDYAGHSRCLPGSIIEMLSFDLAIAEAMKFADSNGETLIIVTADHETGGLVIMDGDVKTGHVMGLYFTDDHTPAMIPVFAYGPGSDKFRGVYINTEIAKNIKSLVRK